MTLLEFFENVYLPLRLLGRSPNTTRLYRSTITLYSRSLCRPAQLIDLNEPSICRHLAWLEKQEYARASIAKERSQLAALANLAARRKLIDRWLELPTIIVPERIPEGWQVGELQRLMTACRAAQGEICGIPAAAWWPSLHLALWSTGERISAILSCSWPDYRAGWLIARAEARKGSRRDRAYRLSDEAIAALEAIREPRRSLIWPLDFSLGTLYDRYKVILAAAELPIDRRSKFHRMRRSVASHLKAAGVDPQAQLDHRNSRTTAKYLDPRIAVEVPASEILPKIG